MSKWEWEKAFDTNMIEEDGALIFEKSLNGFYVALKEGEKYILEYAGCGTHQISICDKDTADLLASAPELKAENERLTAINAELLKVCAKAFLFIDSLPESPEAYDIIDRLSMAAHKSKEGNEQ